MGKKKSKAKQRRNDTRGFSTSNTTPKQTQPATSTSTPAASPSNKQQQHHPLPKTKGGSCSNQQSFKSSENSGVATGRIEMSMEAQNRLMGLLDELKSTLTATTTTTKEKGVKKKKGRINLNDEKVLKKASGLHDKLEHIGFSRNHIQSILIGLATNGIPLPPTPPTLPHQPHVELFSLESALDWACLHLPSQDLPKILVEVDLVAGAIGGWKANSECGISLGTRTFPTKQAGGEEGKGDGEGEGDGGGGGRLVDVRIDDGREERIEEEKKRNEKLKREEEEAEMAKRAYLLQQYQYEHEDGDDDDDHHHHKDTAGGGGSHTMMPLHSSPPPTDNHNNNTKTSEETRLEKLEAQILQDTADLKDDGANYMRSKYETAEIQKRLRKLTSQAKGLRKKVEKQQRERRVVEEDEVGVGKEGGGGGGVVSIGKKESGPANNDTGDDNNDGMVEEGGLFNLFGDDDDDDDGEETATAATAAADDNEPITKTTNEPSQPPTTPPPPPTMQPSIPKDWTGKTPKIYLLEYTQKRRYPKPTYQKLAGSQNGCRAIIRFSIGSSSSGGSSKSSHHHNAKTKTNHHTHQTQPLSVEEHGPFLTFEDAQQYAATTVLYRLNPTLPLYRLFPPVFRDRWLGWLEGVREEKAEKLRLKQEKVREDRMDMMDSVRRMLRDVPMLQDGEGEEEEEEEESVVGRKKEEQEDIVDNWDEEESQSSNDANLNVPTPPTPPSTTPPPPLPPSKPTQSGTRIKTNFLQTQKSPQYQKMATIRSNLPIHQYRQQLLNTIHNNAVTIVHAETGAGKTTQLPSYLLEQSILHGLGDRTSIICTQPRRISALSVSERVAEELCDDRPMGSGHVGYHIRMEARKGPRTKLLFCTTGVVLRRLQDDPDLRGVTHVVVDEVHERQWQIDFLLIALRRLLGTTRKNDLKVVLMSATLDSKLFSTFFLNAPLISIPGRTFPISEYYLEDILDSTGHVIEQGSRNALHQQRHGEETTTMWVTGRGGQKKKEVVDLGGGGGGDNGGMEGVSDMYEGYSMATRRSMDRVDETIVNYDLIEDLLTLLLIHPEKNSSILPPPPKEDSASFLTTDADPTTTLSKGSILLFLPGIGEIRTLHERLRYSRVFGDGNKFDIIPMHSALSSKDQKRAFLEPKRGCQKIILATNIAETSVTIADCVCVIDTGLVREVRQDKRSSTSALITDWTSKASAKQRSGRAGRVQPGISCKLYSSHTAHSVMKQQSIPELQRVPLEEVCLSILAGGLAANCTNFLLQAPQPPDESSVRAALRVLEEVGALQQPVAITTKDGGGNGSSTSETRIETLTPLGRHLAKLPVHVRLGKMLIFGALFKVLDKVLTIAASLSASKSPFSTNLDDSAQAAAAHRSFTHPTSDFLTVCNVWEAYRKTAFSNNNKNNSGYSSNSAAVRKFCTANYLNRNALIEIGDMRQQFVALLGQIGFVSSSSAAGVGSSEIIGDDIETNMYNTNAKKEEIVTAVVCAGLYPSNIAHAVWNNRGAPPNLFDRDGERVYIHKSSVNHCTSAVNLESEWVAFNEKFATSRVFLSSTCLVKPFSLLLFCGSIMIHHLERKAVIDDQIELNIAAQTAVMFRELRHKLTLLLNELIEVSDKNLNDGALINGIVKLLSCE